jgi:hypothetical protein
MNTCPHCQNPLTKDGPAMECSTCQVAFFHDKIDGQHIKWERTINNFDWALNIYPETNHSSLMGFRSSPVHDGDLVLTQIKIDCAIQNVTPDNVVDKIKHILLFS